MKLITVLFLASAFTAFADPLECPATGTLQSYIDLGSTGCYVGSVILWDFQFTADVAATSNPTTTDVMLTTAAGTFGSPDGLTISDGDGVFSIGPSQSIHFFVDFNITARFPDAFLYAVGLNGAAAETGSGNNSKVREIISSFPGPTQLGQMQVTQGNSGSFQYRDFEYQTTIHVNKEFDLSTGNNPEGAASLGVVSQEFLVTPEPGSMALLGGGSLLLLLATGRKRRLCRQSMSENG